MRAEDETMKHYTPYKIYNWVADAPIKSGPKTVLLVLARYLNQKDNGLRVWPSQSTIGKKALMHRNSVRANLRQLEKLGISMLTSSRRRTIRTVTVMTGSSTT